MRHSNLMVSSACAALALFAGVNAQVTADNTTMPTGFYYTRPLSQAPALNVTIQDGFTPGYVFMSPYKSVHPAPYIYDKFGNLVWDGYGVVGSANAHDFRPCTYKGAAHLCYTQVNQQNGYGIGQAMIIDSDYKTIATAQTAGNIQPADMHEFQLLDDGETAILSSYNVIPYDMSYYNITSGLGWVDEGVFQVVNTTTGEVQFEWFSANHVDVEAAQLLPNATDTGGDGFTPATAFDAFHINSIDRAPSGNYLVSSRHTCTLFYVNATDRSISWRLSFLGDSDFTLTNFNFSYQHDARLISENETTTLVTIFDNASNGYTTTTSQSSGKLIAIDHTSGTATMLSNTTFPSSDGVLATSQGNTQMLSNGGWFHSWGSQPYFSEHSANGTAVLLAQFADVGTAQNYRAFSADWASTPSNTIPDVYSYSLNNASATHIYVSWNGATTVSMWRVYGTQEIGEEFAVLGNATKSGFETMWVAEEYFAWVMVEAVGADGAGIRNSSFQPTFVPGAQLASSCSSAGCAVASTYAGGATT